MVSGHKSSCLSQHDRRDDLKEHRLKVPNDSGAEASQHKSRHEHFFRRSALLLFNFMTACQVAAVADARHLSRRFRVLSILVPPIERSSSRAARLECVPTWPFVDTSKKGAVRMSLSTAIPHTTLGCLAVGLRRIFRFPPIGSRPRLQFIVKWTLVFVAVCCGGQCKLSADDRPELPQLISRNVEASFC